MHYFHVTLLVLYLNAIHASIDFHLKNNVQSLVNEPEGKKNISTRRDNGMRNFHINKKHEDAKDKKSARDKAKILQHVRTHEKHLNYGRDMPMHSSKFNVDHYKLGKEYYHMDPVLNELRYRRVRPQRRRGSKKTDSDSKSSSTSTDSEEEFWKDRWREQWMQKKFEALNSTQLRGDVVNMAAARPWGVPCGDPNQHDMPWGNCMLAPECDAEYRIFRGDYFCGRSSYVCCAVLVTNYDMYQGLDMSFEGTSFETDTYEKNREKSKSDSNEASKKRKRKRQRDKRKRKIRKNIKKIVREIRHVLNRAKRNGTEKRKKKTRQLKRFIKLMKRQYRKDRKAVVNVHEHELVKIDKKLYDKLNKIKMKKLNERYLYNDTFTDLVVNGTLNTARLRSFLKAHPNVSNLFKNRRTGLKLGSEFVKLESKLESEEPKLEIKDLNSENEKKKKAKNRKPRLRDYDIEYGMLYY